MPAKSSKPRSVVAEKPRKRGKSSSQLREKADAIELDLAYRENFWDLIRRVVYDTQKVKRVLADRRRKRAHPEEKPIDVRDDLAFRAALKSIGTMVANATGHAGAEAEFPGLIAAWNRDPERVMVFLEFCIAEAANPIRVKSFRADQALVSCHDKAVRLSRAAKRVGKGEVWRGKAAPDDRGKFYRTALSNDATMRDSFAGVSDGGLQKRALRIGLEGGVRMNDHGGEKPDPETVRAVARALGRGRA